MIVCANLAFPFLLSKHLTLHLGILWLLLCRKAQAGAATKVHIVLFVKLLLVYWIVFSLWFGPAERETTGAKGMAFFSLHPLRAVTLLTPNHTCNTEDQHTCGMTTSI